MKRPRIVKMEIRSWLVHQYSLHRRSSDSVSRMNFILPPSSLKRLCQLIEHELYTPSIVTKFLCQSLTRFPRSLVRLTTSYVANSKLSPRGCKAL